MLAWLYISIAMRTKLKLLCKVGWHADDWSYDPRDMPSIRSVCAQYSICRLCGRPKYRVRHFVEHWQSDGFFKSTESVYIARDGNNEISQPQDIPISVIIYPLPVEKGLYGAYGA